MHRIVPQSWYFDNCSVLFYTARGVLQGAPIERVLLHNNLTFGLDPEKPPGLDRRFSQVLVALPVLFNLVFLASELLIGAYPLNDHALHFVASVRAGESLFSDPNPMDTWLAEVSAGYPLWRAYAPLPHFITGLLIRLCRPLLDPWSVFLGIHYALLSFLPVAFYWLARTMGLGRFAAALAASFSVMLSGSGDFGRFGLSYGAQVWRGSGLYPQLWGLWAGLLAMGAFTRCLRNGRAWIAAGVALAIACLSHLIMGVVVLLSTVVLFFVIRDVPAARRLGYAVRALALCGLLSAFFLVPLILESASVNLSRWEGQWKWDSFGAEAILRALAKGELLDSGRLPILTSLLAAGTLIGVWQVFATRQVPPSLALALFWLILFFGRTTWGHLLKLAGIPAGMHLHRLQAAFEIFAVLLAGVAVARIVDLIRPRHSRARLVATVLWVGLPLGALYADRAAYLKQNTQWGVDNLVAHRNAAPTLEPVLRHLQDKLLAQPGRVYAGLASGWGGSFRIGSSPLFTILAARGIANIGFLFHSLSPLSDPSVLLDDRNLADLQLFGIRYVLAPRSWQPAPGLQLSMSSGDYLLYEVPGAGLFEVVVVPHAFAGAPPTWFEPSRDWLRSPLRSFRRHIALYRNESDLPPERYGQVLRRWDPLPPPRPVDTAAPGAIVRQWSDPSGSYHLTASLSQNAHLLFRAGFHPGLRAEVDGVQIEPVAVTPGMAAFPLPAGVHTVRIFYTAGVLKTLLLVFGWTAALVFTFATRHAGLAVASFAISALRDNFRPLPMPSLAGLPAVITKSQRHHAPLLVILVLATLALRPTYRGLFLSGHDAAEYPPRMVELHENLRHGDWFPIWAKDLANGHGQPLFEFLPPTFYWAAEALHLAGAGLTDSLQLAALLLGLLGALSCYGMGVQLGSRHAGVVMAAAYLFLPYLNVNLYVRGNFMEFTAMTMLPFAVWMVWRALADPSWRSLPMACIAVAIFLLSHNAITMFGLPVLALCGLALLERRGQAQRLTAALLGGGSLAFWFLAPALWEKRFVHVDRLREGYLHFHNHFVAPGQLLYSPWGYGLSLPGTNDGMSFMIGPVHLLLAALGSVAVWRGVRSSNLQKRVFVALLACGVLASVLTTSLSRPLWDASATLQYVEFPWRALSVAGFCFSILCGAGLLPLSRSVRTPVAGLFVALLVLANLHHASPQRFLTFDDEYYAPDRIARDGMNTTTREEYEPASVRTRPQFSGNAVEPITCAAGFQVTSRDDARPQRRSWRITAVAPCRARLSVLDYPGWQLTLDGRPVPHQTEPEFGRILVDIPAGQHTLAATLGHTPLRAVARAVSLLAVLVLGLLAVYLRIPRPVLVCDQLSAPDPPSTPLRQPSSPAPIPPVFSQSS